MRCCTADLTPFVTGSDSCAQSRAIKRKGAARQPACADGYHMHSLTASHLWRTQPLAWMKQNDFKRLHRPPTQSWPMGGIQRFPGMTPGLMVASLLKQICACGLRSISQRDECGWEWHISVKASAMES